MASTSTMSAQVRSDKPGAERFGGAVGGVFTGVLRAPEGYAASLSMDLLRSNSPFRVRLDGMLATESWHSVMSVVSTVDVLYRVPVCRAVVYSLAGAGVGLSDHSGLAATWGGGTELAIRNRTVFTEVRWYSDMTNLQPGALRLGLRF